MTQYFIGPTGKQIPDHTLELLDLPLASAAGTILVADTNKVFAEMSGDNFITSKMSTGNETTRVWSASKSTSSETALSNRIGDVETLLEGLESALTAILGV